MNDIQRGQATERRPFITDPLTLARLAIAELITVVNSGDVDHDRVDWLRDNLAEISKNGNSTSPVMEMYSTSPLNPLQSGNGRGLGQSPLRAWLRRLRRV